MMIRAALVLVGMVTCVVTANLLMKIGASAPRVPWLLGLASWQSLVGAFFFALGLPFYMLLLKWLPLNVAQSMAAAQFVAVILASYVFLQEPITKTRLIGICLIVAGILLVASTVEEG